MPQPIPYHRLYAQAEAWPLISESAFIHCTVQLGREPSTLLDKPSGLLADDLEEHLRQASAGMSIENLRKLRDGAWFSDSACSGDLPLAEYLGRLSSRYLQPSGREVRLSEWASQKRAAPLPEQAARWRLLSLYLPPDLLVAGLYSSGRREPPCEDVSLLTWQLAKLLSAPVSETHLHLGAAVPFRLLWTSLVRQMASDPPPEAKFSWGVGAPFNSGKDFPPRLMAACLCRILLASCLWRFEQNGAPSCFEVFCKEHLRTVVEKCHWPLGLDHGVRHLGHAIAYQLHLREAGSLPVWKSLYRHLIGPDCLGNCDSIDELLRCDPLSEWLGPGEGLAFPETRFTHRALYYLRHSGRADARFAQVFWQYQRVRGLLYRYLTQSAGTSGLDWFHRHYSRISPIRRGLENLTAEAALRCDGAGLHLRSLEVRTVPSSNWAEVRETVRGLGKVALNWEPPPGLKRPEVGFLFHFAKSYTWKAGTKTFVHIDPGPTGWRCGKWFSDCFKQSSGLVKALELCPELLLVFRGLDVASVELSIPTWPLVPLFERVRAASQAASRRLAIQHPRWQVPPLRSTVHAGEDYRRLIEGIRRVHEAVEFGLIGRGDRIGHGLALAADPQCWADSAPMVAQPAEDRLDDLIWELERYGTGELCGEGSRREYARTQALQIGREIYGRRHEITVDNLIEARRMRFNPVLLRQLGFPNPILQRPSGLSGARRILYKYLTDHGVFERGQRPIEVPSIEASVVVAKRGQAWLRQLLARLEITVEVNPSSNLIIADMSSLEDHPLLRLQPLPGRPEPDGGAVLASINSDDPTTFATSLGDEYAYIYLTLLRLGVCATDALRWLDRLREIGWQSRFTLPASKEKDCLKCMTEPR